MSEQPCHICGKETDVLFNIDFRSIPICESCANSIALQQVQDLTRSNVPAEGKQNEK